MSQPEPTRTPDAALGLGSGALGFKQLRVPQDENEALAMLTFWVRNTVTQIDAVIADGWSPALALTYAKGDLANALSYIDRLEAVDAAS